MAKTERPRVPVLGDVARHAGVSVPTVSRVLTGSTPVSDATRSKVEKAIDELGYRPNEAARALVRGQQSMVGIITGNTVRFGYARTMQGIEEAARARGLLVAITVLDSPDLTEVQRAIDIMLRQPLVGVVVLDFDAQGEFALSLLPKGLPVAAVSSTSRSDRGVPQVLFDDRRGGEEATEYLLSLGHRTVHYLAAPTTGRPSGRMEGWRAALERHGIDVPPLVEADWSSESGYRAGATLAVQPDVTAVLCGNDEIAFGFMKALRDAHREVPGDVSVVGFDDHPHSALWAPTLTTMGQDFVQLGRAAFTLLMARVDGTPTLLVDAPQLHLVVRESAAPPRS